MIHPAADGHLRDTRRSVWMPRANCAIVAF